jgi:hypothetical protein
VWLRDSRAGGVRGQRGAHARGAPPAFLVGVLRALPRRGVAIVYVPEPYTHMHCSRLRKVGGGKLQRCCEVVRQDYLTARRPDGSTYVVHKLVCCPSCNGGRKPEHRDYAGARGIYFDVLDMLAERAGRREDITSTPARWVLVLKAWGWARTAAAEDDEGGDDDDEREADTQTASAAAAGGGATGGQPRARPTSGGPRGGERARRQ